MRRLIAIALLAPLASCINFTWQHRIALERVSDAKVASLASDTSDLGQCLEVLGAPLYVWEYRGDELVLGYGWLETRDWGAGIRVQLSSGVSVSFNYDSLDEATEGYLLFFDDAWTLKAVRKGNLRELARGLERQRPAPIEE